jgi:HEAT repeat protein
MEPGVRAYLIGELRETRGGERLQEVARLLIRYVHQLKRMRSSTFSPHELQAEQWSAMAYIGDLQGEVARGITTAFRDQLATGASGALDENILMGEAELARLVRITQELAPQLQDYPELLHYAEDVGKLLTDPGVDVLIKQKVNQIVTSGIKATAENLADQLKSEQRHEVLAQALAAAQAIADEEGRAEALAVLAGQLKGEQRHEVLAQALAAAQAIADEEGRARVLEALGGTARNQAPRLIELLRDLDPSVRAAAARALGALGVLGALSEAAMHQAPRLVELLYDIYPSVRAAAAGALGALGGIARDQAPQLIKLLRDLDPNVRAAAVSALGALGGITRDQAPQLVELLTNGAS